MDGVRTARCERPLTLIIQGEDTCKSSSLCYKLYSLDQPYVSRWQPWT